MILSHNSPELWFHQQIGDMMFKALDSCQVQMRQMYVKVGAYLKNCPHFLNWRIIALRCCVGFCHSTS